MSSIRLFILDALLRGEAHGHQLRADAAAEYVELWTDIQVGGLYGTLKRMAVEGLLEIVRTETVGNYPERTVYAITEEGLDALSVLRHEMLRQTGIRMDPFDLALSRARDVPQGELRTVLAARRAEYAHEYDRLREQLHGDGALANRMTTLELHLADHVLERLSTEVRWHDKLIADIPGLVGSFADLPADEEVGVGPDRG